MFTKIIIYALIWLCAINSCLNMVEDENTLISKIGIASFFFTIFAGLILVLYGSLL